MKTISWVVSVLLGLLIIALGLIYFLPGWDLYIVQSESMQPVLSARDMIITRPLAGKVEAGDIITFQLGTQKITHRVDAVDGDLIITKGDANEDPDLLPVTMSQVSGRYFFKVPGVGHLTSFISTRIGWFLVIIVPAALLVFWLVFEIIRAAWQGKKKEVKRTEQI